MFVGHTDPRAVTVKGRLLGYRVSLCPETCSVDQTDLELTDIRLPLPPEC